MSNNEKIEEGLEFDPQFNMRSPKSPEAELLTVVVQESETKEVLMTAFATREAVVKTLESGKATFYSRSRGIWTKGETSGNALLIDQILVDCDQDTLLYQVIKEKGGACHTTDTSGKPRSSCFYRKLTSDKLELI